MTYPEAIHYLESLINYEAIPSYSYKKSFKLERVKAFLSSIGNPQASLRCIHIAGSKGKGSTCSFISYVLKEAGFKVGLYTSPHLSDFRERIRILSPRPQAAGFKLKLQDDFEGMISRRELTSLVSRFKPTIENYNRLSEYGPLSFFEVYTALAFVFFCEQKVDFAVLETGLGGRLDATNVVNPLVCALTPISYEHTQKLGSTLKEIATEKAGIIKSHRRQAAGHKLSDISSHRVTTSHNPAQSERNLERDEFHDARYGNSRHQVTRQVPNFKLTVISAPQEPEALKAIKKRCTEAGARLYIAGKDILYRAKAGRLSVKGMYNTYPNLKLSLAGAHQMVNACVALGVIEALRKVGVCISLASVKRGLLLSRWPGRCEVVSRNPLIVLDGAQNASSSKALKTALTQDFKFKKVILLLGISSDKDIQGIAEEFLDFADRIVLTKSMNPRATPPELLSRFFPGKTVQVTHSVKEAITVAQSKASREDLILCTGSLFVVGEARSIFRKGPSRP